MLWDAVAKPLEGFLRSWGTPLEAPTVPVETRQLRYRTLWGFYDGTAFDDLTAWAKYRRHHTLYRGIRQVWDHVHSLVEFYATHVWSGTIPENGFDLPDGVENAIPFAQDTDRGLLSACGQLMQWWNWQERMVGLVRYTAAVGELLVELVDDLERGRVDVEFVWPGYVKAVDLDSAGNVRSYVIEYWAVDPTPDSVEAALQPTSATPLPFSYRREVDLRSFRTYRNDELTSEVPNPYGFVPACWFRHHALTGIRGEPAIWATMTALDEVNGLFSHLVDRTHQNLASPIVVTGNLTASAMRRAIGSLVEAAKRPFSEDLPLAGSRPDRETLNVWEGPQGTDLRSVDLKAGDAVAVLDRLIAGIEKKCPEVVMYEHLRTMTQLTGPAASRLLGDVEKKVRTVAAGYDRQLVKLLQMAVAIAGWRVGRREWPSDDQRAKFQGFDLTSWGKDELRLNIMPRELVPITIRERFEILEIKRRVLPSIPEEVIAVEAGYRAAEAKAWVDERVAREEREAARAVAAEVAVRRSTPSPEIVAANGR